jgi:hypothetical protein
MSQLADLTAAGNSTAIPGHTISPPRLLELAEAEMEAARNYLAILHHSSRELPEAIQSTLHRQAADNLQASPFSFGTPRFNLWALSARGTQFIAWLSLRITEPSLRLAQAVQLLMDYPAAAAAVLDAWGFKKKLPPMTKTPSQSTGQPSSTVSPSPLPMAVASPTTRPAT